MHLSFWGVRNITSKENKYISYLKLIECFLTLVNLHLLANCFIAQSDQQPGFEMAYDIIHMTKRQKALFAILVDCVFI